MRAAWLAGLAGGGGAFDPLTLFGGSDRGWLIDNTDPLRLFQSSAGTTAVAAAVDPIGYSLDGGPLAKHAVQATGSRRPYWFGAPKQVGAQKVTDPDFTGPTAWVGGTGWTPGVGSAVKVAGVASDLSTDITLADKEPCLIFVSMSRTAGTLMAKFTGGTTITGTARDASGSFTDTLVAVSGNTTLTLSADAAFAGSVKRVVVFPIAAFANMGAYFDGVTHKLATAAADLSNNDKCTVVLSCQYGDVGGNRTPFEIGNYYSNTAGSVAGLFGTNPQGRIRGDAAQATVATPSTEGAAVGNPEFHVASFQVDLSKTTIAEEIIVRTRGVTPTQTPSGTTAGGGNMVNGALSIGQSANDNFPWRGLIHRIGIINRTLSAGELAQFEGWAKGGMVYLGVIGDSTSAINSAAGGLTATRSTSSFVGGAVCSRGADVSTAGDTIAMQLTRWTAIADKSAMQAVLIQIGLNDVNSYMGGTKTSAQIIADLQSLVNTVRADAPQAKILISQMTPARGWLGVARGQEAAAYQGWLDVNEAIAGNGVSPITGVDKRITAHVALLNDGAGGLRPIYDHNSDGVHPSNEGKFVIATQSWRPALVELGLLT